MRYRINHPAAHPNAFAGRVVGFVGHQIDLLLKAVGIHARKTVEQTIL